MQCRVSIPTDPTNVYICPPDAVSAGSVFEVNRWVTHQSVEMNAKCSQILMKAIPKARLAVFTVNTSYHREKIANFAGYIFVGSFISHQ